MPNHLRRLVLAAACLCVLSIPETASAQGFISPFIGFTYGGDAACPGLLDCDDKSLNFGVGVGKLGRAAGVETEFGYARDFFKDAAVGESSVLTLMSNLMIAPRISFVRPYFTIGAGLIKTHIEFSPSSILSIGDNHFGWNWGGGVMLMSGNFGFRGDIRLFHSWGELQVFGLDLGDLNLDYNRASAALVLSF